MKAAGRPEFPARQMFEVIEEFLVGQASSGETQTVTRSQLEPLTEVLRK